MSANALRAFTVKTCTDKKRFKKEVLNIRKEGIAFDDEEYLDGVVAFSIPLKANSPNLQVALWVVGLKQQVRKETISLFSNFLKKIAEEINHRFLGIDPEGQ